MKKITILMLAFLAASCIEKSDVRPGSPVDVDIDHYQMAGTYDVPVKEGCMYTGVSSVIICAVRTRG